MRKHFAYYNEFDPNAAAWLRELITLGAIMDGEVDERSITDVRADDLDGFTRCHFFAGIGGWDLALRRAGWRDDVPVWTGSCPCQDFSCAGKQEGFEGKRDLWPAFHNLIRQRRPELVFGEQVKNAVRHGWLDRLYADLEGEDYACGSVVLGAHSAGADHIRQRIYWVADSQHPERRSERDEHAEPHGRDGLGGSGVACGMEDSERDGRNERGAEREGLGGSAAPVGRSAVGGMGDAEINGRKMRDGVHGELHGQGPGEGRDAGGMGDTCLSRREGHRGLVEERISAGRESEARYAPETGGYDRNFWSDAIPHLCKDGKLRRFEPGVQPLVAKLPRSVGHSGDPRLAEYADQTPEARVMRLKGYGNAICVETAKLFIEAVMDELEQRKEVKA